MGITKKTTRGEPQVASLAFDSALAEEYSIVQPAPDMAAEIDSLEDVLRERLGNGEPIDDVLDDLLAGELREKRREIYAEVLLKILLLIADSQNPKLDVEVLIAASGLPLRQGISHTAIAKSFGITRACFSARVKNVVEKLGLTPPRACKAPESKDAYKLSNRRNYKPVRG